MAPIVDIDVSAWPSNGEAATAGTTGFHAITGTWTHHVDADGRKYIEKANGSAGTITVANPADTYGSPGDRARIHAGIMLARLATIDYTTVGTVPERFIDNLSGERTIMLLRHGTSFYGGEQWRLECTEFGATATLTSHPKATGLEFNTIYELGLDHAYASPGWIRVFIDGFQLDTVDAGDMTGVNADRINYWQFADVPNDRVRYRIYGDRDDRIRVWDDDFAIRPRTELESVAINRPLDIQVETAYTGRNFWRAVSGDSFITPSQLGSGGVSPGRMEWRVSGGAAEVETIDAPESGSANPMIVCHGCYLDAGGTLEFSFSTVVGERPLDSTSLMFAVRFDGSGNLQVRNSGVDSWTTVASYTEGKYYDLRINRAETPIRVSIENISDGFSASATFGDVGTRADAAFVTTAVDRVTIDANGARFNMVQFLDVDWVGLVSSYAETEANGLTPNYATPNRVWGHFPKVEEYAVLPGFLERDFDLTKPWATSTGGRSGNAIVPFNTYNTANLGILGNKAGGLVLVEWAVNDLTGVRLSEANTLTMVETIMSAMQSIIDKCCDENIYCWVGKLIGYPTGLATDWQAYSIAALDSLNQRVQAYMRLKNRPDLLYFADVPGVVGDYFSGADDIHFDDAGDALYASQFLAVASPVSGESASSARRVFVEEQ